MIYLIIF